jgi:2-polyprenyl-6-methoxyphenol hydroxylase-like FAD-dependent oxidoreductase
MSGNNYDAIVIGARCAGAPTAMLLARSGHRVLVVDRASFPSDTLSTHMIHAPGVAALRRWGLLDQVLASGCPPVGHYSLDFGPVTISGTQRPAVDGGRLSYAPRRTVLDKVLVDAAAAAGAEVRERFTVEDIVIEGGAVVGIKGHGDDGSSVLETARVVVGADGRNSHVARAVRPEQYNEKPVLQGGAYTYFSSLPVDAFEIVIRPDRGFAALPTNDGLTLVAIGWPASELAAFKSDVEGNFMQTLELDPSMADRARAATRVERFHLAEVPNFFRTPYGAGWVLVGDAGYTRDPITAQGISDAFQDAERCASALDEVLTGARRFDDAMAAYHRDRDARVLPVYEFTAQLATLAPPPPEMQQLIAAMAGNQDAMDAFVSVIAGTLSPVEFFDPGHLGGIFAAANAGDREVA